MKKKTPKARRTRAATNRRAARGMPRAFLILRACGARGGGAPYGARAERADARARRLRDKKKQGQSGSPDCPGKQAG